MGTVGGCDSRCPSVSPRPGPASAEAARGLRTRGAQPVADAHQSVRQDDPVKKGSLVVSCMVTVSVLFVHGQAAGPQQSSNVSAPSVSPQRALINQYLRELPQPEVEDRGSDVGRARPRPCR